MGAGGELHWDDLRYFLHALRAGSLAGAARALRVQHTTVGRRLTALEQALGAPLVLRSSEGLQPTRLGEELVPFAEQIDKVVAELRERLLAQAARVRLAVPSGFAALFTPWLPSLRRDHPELSLELVSGARRVDLAKGEADLALRHGTTDDADVVAKRLGVSGWSLYAAESYLTRRGTPDEPTKLTGHEIIGYDVSLATMPAARWVEACGAVIVMRSREMTDMLAAALSGVGLAVLPCMLGDAEAGLRRLIPELVATRDLWLVYRRELRTSDKLRAVIRLVTTVVQGNAERISGRSGARSTTG